MKFGPGSAANRIALLGWLIYAAATLLLGIAVYFATHAAFSRQIDERIEQATSALLIEYHDDGVGGVQSALDQQGRNRPIGLGTALFDARGARIAGNLAIPLTEPGWRNIVFHDPGEGREQARAQVTVLPGNYRLVVAADLESLETIDHTILAMFGVTVVVLLLLGLAGALLLARYLHRRLAGIEATSSAIVRGDFTRRAGIGTAGDEFDRVALSLNTMLDRIAGLIANLRQVTAGLAHDLRTPLSHLRNHLERMRGGQGQAATGASIDEAVAQADNVLALFDAILRISEVEEGSLRRAFSAVDLSTLVSELGDTLVLLAEDERHFLHVAVGDGIRVQGDRELIAQALTNLVENALRHTPEGSVIGLQVRCDEGGALVTVSDNGPGIPEADHERAQQRFVRLESARSAPGHGLGLSMVRAIAQAHGATFSLGDAGPGLRAEIRFPKRIIA
ncbi:putative two-component histidine kinase [Caenibius tardaugens NBRC 16725]|uniref:histidine kinase n=1 Tax=Caenibius tardaugens NBRC 16725 TaxID=1219035 RepID=U3A4N0_9SPHN|nr:HAMP domain-containing sensor histidine kinase [Caenibius tardaugens]AZI37734.1 sensor histidine kinase [Caenibius tardaugens NBRC 16725]GAD49708.1 putative two-component histidine kinase [Caenibius tardaugens NBRC 16725]